MNKENMDDEESNFEYLYKRAPINKFIEEISNMSYRDLNALYQLLSEKYIEINQQLSIRRDDSTWEKKTKAALSFIIRKRDLVLQKINKLRGNSVNDVLSKFNFDPKKIKSRRFAVIQCLVSIINKNIEFSELEDNERAIIDESSNLVEDSEERFNPPLDYDPILNKITSNNGKDIALMCPNQYMQEEYGLMFARSLTANRMLKNTASLLQEISSCGKEQFSKFISEKLYDEIISHKESVDDFVNQ